MLEYWSVCVEILGMKGITYTTETAGATDWLTILAAHARTRIILQGENLYMHSKTIILTRENQTFTASRDLTVIRLDRSFSDALFFSQLYDCRILLDLLEAHDPEQEHLYFLCQETPDIAIYLKQVIQELTRPSIYQDKMVHLLIIALLTELDRSRRVSLIVPYSSMVPGTRFGRIMKYIGDHYTTCTLKETAELFGYNPDYLSVLFKTVTGENFNAKVRSMRLQQAAHMLTTTVMTVEEIALANGFHDKSWFSRCFKKTYGLTPAQFRKKYQIQDK
jgi:AraC-like DNA-binding protein